MERRQEEPAGSEEQLALEGWYARLQRRLLRRLSRMSRRLASSLSFAVVAGALPVLISAALLLSLMTEDQRMGGSAALRLWVLAAFILLLASLYALSMQRLRRRERELSWGILLEGERQRYHNVGEVSGLVIHEFSNSLIVMTYGIDTLKNHPNKVNNNEFMQGLYLGAARAQELMQSLRSYLQVPQERGGPQSARFGECLDYIRGLLNLRFSAETMDRIQVRTDPSLSDVVIALSKSNLVHILINLIANSVANLVDSKTILPRIDIEEGIDPNADEDFLVFTISDNGSGLSEELFIRLTSADPSSEEAAEGMGKSMGLKLVRRLIERETGAITIVAPRLGKGTTFRLKLPIFQSATNPRPQGGEEISDLDIVDAPSDEKRDAGSKAA